MSDTSIDTGRRLVQALSAYDASYPPSIFTPPVPDVAPVLTTLTPATSVVGVPVTVTITGTGFTATSVVKVDGAVIASTFVSATSMTIAGTPLVDGTADVTVTNGTAASNALTYTVTLVVGDPTATTSRARDNLKAAKSALKKLAAATPVEPEPEPPVVEPEPEPEPAPEPES